MRAQRNNVPAGSPVVVEDIAPPAYTREAAQNQIISNHNGWITVPDHGDTVHRDSYLIGRDDAVRDAVTTMNARLTHIESTHARMEEYYRKDKEQFLMLMKQLQDNQKKDRDLRSKQIEEIVRTTEGKVSMRDSQTEEMKKLLKEMRDEQALLQEENAKLWKSHQDSSRMVEDMRRERTCEGIKESVYQQCVIS